MKFGKTALALSIASILAACGGGDINIDPQTNVSNSNNTTNPPPVTNTTVGNEVCASYTNTGGQVIQGTYDGTNCTYSPSFVDAGNNLTTDMTIPALASGGAHIFEGSLFVGETYSSDAEMQAAGIFEGGDGPTLTIEAGTTLAFQTSADFMIINRGSQLFAVGREDAPITITSVSDVNGTVGATDVQQWGGMVINGFGVTNKCAYTGSVAGGDLALDGECHVDAEGAAGLDESQYGGDNNEDSSGRMEYVVIKHTGATVGNGDELNGISFGGVGSNTLIRNLEVYSTYDDGIEMFGGAVSFENFVAMYVRDDAIDIDEGWSGTITNALVIQAEDDGNHCIEADGLGSYSSLDAATVESKIAQGINSRPTINHLTCIISPHDFAVSGTHDPGAGWRFREGIFPVVNDSIVVGSFQADTTSGVGDNYCLRIDNRSQQAATEGDLVLNSVVIACEETFKSAFEQDFAAAATTGIVTATVPAGAVVDPTIAADTDLQLLEGTPAIYSIPFAASFVDGAAPDAAATPRTGDYLGALSLGAPDWTANWTYGIHEGARAIPLWFE